MNTEIENLYREIALGIYAARPIKDWSEGIYRFISISEMSNETCSFVLQGGETAHVLVDSQVTRKAAMLRSAMASVHETGHAWYKVECRLTPAGKFHYEFDYEKLPPFHIVPSPAKWLAEFQAYPRPAQQEKIQDWIDGKVQAEVVVARLMNQ